MNFNGLTDTRFKTAIKVLEEGKEITTNGVTFRAGENNNIHCSIISSWQPDRVSANSAELDFATLEETIKTLCENSEFAQIINSCVLEKELIHNYGNGKLLLCKKENNKLIWSEGFPNESSI